MGQVCIQISSVTSEEQSPHISNPQGLCYIKGIDMLIRLPW